MFSSMLNFLLEHLIFLALHAESASAFPKPLSPAKQQEYFGNLPRETPLPAPSSLSTIYVWWPTL